MFPAVIVGGSGACGLGVVRSLSRATVPVIVLDTSFAEPAMHSRFARKRKVSSMDGSSLVHALLELGEELGGPALLFPTSDEAVLTLSRYRGELAGRYLFQLASHDCLTLLMHKTRFQQVAERHGFPLPRSARIERAADLSMLKALRYPCIVKPAIKNSDYVRQQFPRAYKVASVTEAADACRNILPFAQDVVVQEWIEGGDDDLYFCLQYRTGDGKTRSSFTGRKLSIWPPDVGTTASCIAAPDAHPILHALTDAFFNAVSFTGMGGIEYKKDARTGDFVMIEPTVGRVDAQEESATLNGVNLPLAAYACETGLQLPYFQEGRPRVIWRDSFAHLRSVRAKKVDPTERNVTVEPACAVYDAYWRSDDPLPWLFHAAKGGMKLVRNAFNQK